MSLQASEYLVVARAVESPKVRLVCFPHSGGGPSVFASWSTFFAEHSIEVVAVSAPGRERRVAEPPLKAWRPLVREICSALEASGLVDGTPYAFFGHSLGAILAFEAARLLDAELVQGRPRPLHLFASGHGAPAGLLNADVPSEVPWRSLHQLSDEQLLDAVGKFGFLPTEAVSDLDLLKTVLPALRADLQVYGTYSPDAESAPLPLPITALGGIADNSCLPASLNDWKTETTRDFHGPELFPGDHFFVESARDTVMSLVLKRLTESLDALPLSVHASNFTIPDVCTAERMHDVFFARAIASPDVEAVVDEMECVTYGELADRVRMLASLIRAQFLSGNDTSGGVVALLMPHDATYVTCMLSLSAAAAALLVIEAHFNPELCREICEESGAVAAIANKDHAAKFQNVAGCTTLVLDGNWISYVRAQFQKHCTPSAALPRVDKDSLCILMMTSGTTGRPKTIAGSHYFMHVGQHAKNQLVPYTADDDREAFNVMFVWEVLRPLLFGLTSFVIPDKAVLDTGLFVSCLEKNRCTRVLSTPSLLATILQYASSDLEQRLGAMRTWFTCGEVLPMSAVRRFREAMPHCKLVNDYSSWEGADCAYAVVSPKPVYEPSSTFAAAGFIAPGAIVVIVDPETKRTVPQGMVGEVYVGGPQVSNGYYLKPEATAERFVEGFNTEMKASWAGKWYKSGDAARLVGNPVFLEVRGRMDSTVKIRGFKVGIPVVEGGIQEIDGVAMCGCSPVFSAPGIVDSLLCYVRPTDGIDFTEVVQRIKQEGPKKMPRWMLPSDFVLMPAEAFSGGEARKLDRKKLTGLTEVWRLENEKTRIAAAEAENLSVEVEGVRGVVRAIWARSLGIDAQSLDPDENFFDLGGHSTMAAQMASELAKDYGIKVTVLDIYSNSTLAALLDFLDPEGAVAATQGPRLGRAPVASGEGLAIVGMAGRFPGADDVETFWENLRDGTVSATFLTKELMLSKGLSEEVVSHHEFVPCAYMINDVDKFDHKFFGIGRHEASIMDPQHRVFIETSWAALENAALPPRTGLGDTVVGVFAAAGIDGYLIHHLDGMPLKDTMDPGDVFLGEIGNEKDYIATRVSYLLNFTGPSMNVNSACSSALVAAVQAAAAITSGQCDAAVAGASSITFPNLGYRYQDGLVASPDGYVRPFDGAAEGTVFGDAVGALVLRRREDVSNDLIWGQMRGFAVSNDGGRKAGYAAPSSAGQAQAITSALRMMGEDPWSISYVECHATGTKIGDGIEVRGLIDAFNAVGGKPALDSNTPRVALGSIKGNIAHANCAAGVTGLAKTLLMLKNRQLCPVANFRTLNPKVDLADTPFYVNTELCTWSANNLPLRAGVSSFGIGGTNAHVVVDEAPRTEEHVRDPAAVSWSYQVLPFSAKSPASLHDAAERFSTGMKWKIRQGNAVAPLPRVADAAFTLQTGRAEMPFRKAILVKTMHLGEVESDNLSAVADAVVKAMPDIEELDELEEAGKRPTVAFVFPGQGSQYFGMGRELYEEVVVFRNAVDRCCELLSAPDFLGFDLRPILFSSDDGEEIENQRRSEFLRPSVLQPALFVTEYALAQLFLAVGVTPTVTAGHSLGEYAAAVIGGLLTLESACGIVAARAKSTETLAEDGSMLSVADWSPEELMAISRGDREGLWLAAENSPAHAVISGTTSAVEALESELKQAGRKCVKLQVRKAFHSGLITAAANTLTGLGKSQEGVTASIPVASNFTGGWLSADLLKHGSYWTNHMRGTVQWRENAEKLLSQYKPTVVLEVGPMNALSVLTKKCMSEGSTVEFLQGMRHPRETDVHDSAAFLGALGKLWEVGYSVDWHALHTKVLSSASLPSALRLPTYAFERTSLWVNPERSIYVDTTDDPAPAAYAINKSEVQASSAPSLAKKGAAELVRFTARSGSEPTIRAYCLPFASGSSLLFAPWSESEDAIIEVVALELPGRGGRSDEKMPSNDAEDSELLGSLGDAIMKDLRGAQYILVGCSMGGNLSVELALQLAARGAPPPLALYVAGRKPPAQVPDAVGSIEMDNKELAEYAFAPPQVANSPEFVEYVVPMLRADLELDARVERRLSVARTTGLRLPSSVGLELLCGTSDEIAPWSAAPEWQDYSQMPIGMHYYPGGHEFMREQRTSIFETLRRNAIGRLVQQRSMELALLTSQSFGQPITALPVKTPIADARSLKADADVKLPMYAVRWVQAQQNVNSDLSSAAHFVRLDVELSTALLNSALVAMQQNKTVVVATPYAEGWRNDYHASAEVGPCWQLVRLVQHLLEAGASGRLVVVCAAAASGAMVAGASKAVAMETPDFRIQRVFVPPVCLSAEATANTMSLACAVADRSPQETDLWCQDQSLAATTYTQRLDPMLEPSRKLPCVPRQCPDGEIAVYVLTGATGGLGSAVVEWLLRDQQLAPEQLVLLRRAGSTPLKGELAKCRTVEVSQVDSESAMLASELGQIKHINGVFHLAGVLDDGIVQGMTEDRLDKVAKPKCGMLVSLLRVAERLNWPLQWVLGFSSTSSLFGYAGQTNYCAANAMLDQLAGFGSSPEVPQRDRLPCRFIAVNWGPWGEAGMAKVGTKAYEQAMKEGDKPLPTQTALRCLAAALRTATQAQPSAVQFCACDVDWKLSQWAELPILDLVHERPLPIIEAAPALEAPSATEKNNVVREFMVKHTKGGSWKRVQGKSLHQLGLDSLEIVQFRNAFSKAFNVNVPLALIADAGKNVADITIALSALAGISLGAEAPEAPSATEQKNVLQEFMVKHTKGGSWKRVQGKSLHQLGLDSLEIVQFRNAFSKAFNVNAPLALIADASTNVGDITIALSELAGISLDVPTTGKIVGEVQSVADASHKKLQEFMLRETKGGNWKRTQGKSLHQLGLDSLEIVQLRNSFRKEFGVNAPLNLIADASLNVGAISTALGELIGK